MQTMSIVQRPGQPPEHPGRRLWRFRTVRRTWAIGSQDTAASAFRGIVERRERQGPAIQKLAKTDGWLAGCEFAGLPHDKTRTFGDGAAAL